MGVRIFGNLKSNISSIQRGVVTLGVGVSSSNVIIAAVSLTGSRRAVVRVFSRSNYGRIDVDMARIVLESATSIRITRFGSLAANDFYWEVIEYNNVKTLQTGQLLSNIGATPTTDNISITAVNLNKAALFVSFSSDDSVANNGLSLINYLVSTTNIRLIRGSSGNGLTVEWQVIEFN